MTTLFPDALDRHRPIRMVHVWRAMGRAAIEAHSRDTARRRERADEVGMKHALLVEDSAPATMIATAILERAGYAVTHVKSARAAHEACLRRRFALHLVDVTLEGTGQRGWASGVAFVSWLLKYHNADARVVLWSANDHSAKAAELGVKLVRKSDHDALRKAVA